MDDWATLPDAPPCPRAVDVNVALLFERQYVVRGRPGEPQADPDLRIGRVGGQGLAG